MDVLPSTVLARRNLLKDVCSRSK